MQNKPEIFVQAYVGCALWSSYDDDCLPLDTNMGPGDIHPDSLQKMKADCERFQAENETNLDLSGITPSRAGFCFWLSRNGHGSGFFDEETIAPRFRRWLQSASEQFKEGDLYKGDDGKLHVSPL